MLHSKLIITVDSTQRGETFDIKVDGCEVCMVRAIADFMVTNERFRKMVNEAGREANRIRRGEPGPPPVDPHSI